jgi:hypothetical protein
LLTQVGHIYFYEPVFLSNLGLLIASSPAFAVIFEIYINIK